MDVVETVAALRERLAAEPAVVFVPTMGNLHEGHYSLMRVAREHGSCVVASIFVNRLQFGPTEDFDRYPRTFAEDCAGLLSEGVDVLFMPGERELYPQRQEFLVDPGALGSTLEGEFRPGFFRGVCTVVLKLFNIVRPQVAVFGKKDRQQLQLIQDMVEQLALAIRVVPGETARAEDGLALSSRNAYLSQAERTEAPRLFRTLSSVVEAITGGRCDYAALEQSALAELRSHGWKTEYVAVRERDGLKWPAAPLAVPESGLVVLGAAWLGKTRLIDNVDVGPHL